MGSIEQLLAAFYRALHPKPGLKCLEKDIGLLIGPRIPPFLPHPWNKEIGLPVYQMNILWLQAGPGKDSGHLGSNVKHQHNKDVLELLRRQPVSRICSPLG